ncbi:hypothetical protein, partial [Rhodovulum strictum]
MSEYFYQEMGQLKSPFAQRRLPQTVGTGTGHSPCRRAGYGQGSRARNLLPPDGALPARPCCAGYIPPD